MKPPVRLLIWSCVSAAAAVGVLAYGLGAPEATLLGPALIRAAGPAQVALTFDDGPSPYTAQVLDVLKREHVKATFFLCGANAERYPELVRRIRAEGHVIGNHTYSHPWLYRLGETEIAAEIDRTQDVLAKLSGRRPTLFRPPFGVRAFALGSLLRRRGLTMVMWSDRAIDSGEGASDLTRTALKGLAPGAIVLLHDGDEARPRADRAATVAALPSIIRGARAAGYTLAPLRD